MRQDVTPGQAFDQYHQAVYSFAYRLTRRPAVAEDLTQECFLTFVRRPDRFDASKGTVKTYLFAIVRNLALKEFRDQPAEGGPDCLESLVAEDPRAAMEVASAVAAAVSSLPSLQREAILLFEYERFSLEEIAEIVAADVGTVKSRLHRARERLRRQLKEYRKVGRVHGTV